MAPADTTMSLDFKFVTVPTPDTLTSAAPDPPAAGALGAVSHVRLPLPSDFKYPVLTAAAGKVYS